PGRSTVSWNRSVGGTMPKSRIRNGISLHSDPMISGIRLHFVWRKKQVQTPMSWNADSVTDPNGTFSVIPIHRKIRRLGISRSFDHGRTDRFIRADRRTAATGDGTVPHPAPLFRRGCSINPNRPDTIHPDPDV